MQANDKVNIVFSFLATSIYRSWYWSRYKTYRAQQAWRVEWIAVLGQFSAHDIQQGLSSWALRYGIDTPPTPDSFKHHIKPKHTQFSKQGLKNAREAIGRIGI